MTKPLLLSLIDAIYLETRAGGPAPECIELDAALYSHFQHDQHAAMRELGLDAWQPGAVVGIPVVPSVGLGAAVLRVDGTRSTLPVATPLL